MRLCVSRVQTALPGPCSGRAAGPPCPSGRRHLAPRVPLRPLCPLPTLPICPRGDGIARPRRWAVGVTVTPRGVGGGGSRGCPVEARSACPGPSPRLRFPRWEAARPLRDREPGAAHAGGAGGAGARCPCVGPGPPRALPPRPRRRGPFAPRDPAGRERAGRQGARAGALLSDN